MKLRRAVLIQRQADKQARADGRATWRNKLIKQGPWDEAVDPLSLVGAPVLPIPVVINNGESL